MTTDSYASIKNGGQSKTLKKEEFQT